MPFEKLITMQNARYKERGIAVIEKQNTKFIPLRNGTGQIVSCKVEEKSTVDFMGRYRNQPIAFEAKHTTQGAMRFDRVEINQQIFLDDWCRDGAIGFVIVNFDFQKAYAIPWPFYKAAIITRQRGEKNKECTALGSVWNITGKASFNQNELLPEWEVPVGGCSELDYLAVVSKLWGLKV